MSFKNRSLPEDVFELSETQFSWFTEEIKKLGKKADKCGCERPSYEIIHEKDIEINVGIDIHPIKAIVHIYHVKVYGLSPKYNGWKFLGYLENYRDENNENLNIFHNVPGESIPEKYRNVPVHCDHCGWVRYRKYSFVVEKEETGETLCVGSTCLKDFLGHKSPAALARWAEFLTKFRGWIEDEENFGGERFPREEWHFSLDSIVSVAIKMIELYGWCSKKKEHESEYEKKSTANLISSYFFPPYDRMEKDYDKLDRTPPTDEQIAMAEKAIEWARNEMEVKEDDYFSHNLNALARIKYIKPNDFGLAAYLPAAYKKHLNLIEKLSKEKESEWVGEPKERMTRKLKIIGVYEIDGEWGLVIIYRFKDEDGNNFVWFCSNGTNLERGHEEYYTFTIKGHDEWKGIKQTKINRLREAKEKEIKKLEGAEWK